MLFDEGRRSAPALLLSLSLALSLVLLPPAAAGSLRAQEADVAIVGHGVYSDYFTRYHYEQETTGPTQEFFRWTVEGAEDARRKARRLVDAGVDLLKVIQLAELSEGERRAIAQIAEEAGLPVAVHAWFEEEHEMAAEMGATTVEHIGAGPAHAGQFTPAGLHVLARSGVAVIPTALVSEIYHVTEAIPERLDDSRLRSDLPEDVYEDVRASLERPSQLGYFTGKRRITPHYEEMIRTLRDGGVTLGIGTDSGTPMNFHYESTWQEMDLLVRYGLPPMEVITMATRDNARLFGADDDLGKIEAGKYADVIVVDGNPLRHMSALQSSNIVHVFKAGKQHI